jgi:uncharacterized protein
MLRRFWMQAVYPPKDNRARARPAQDDPPQRARLARTADAAYERGDYAAALRLTRQLAEGGYAVAQNNLGLMYLEGKGIPQHEYVAMRLFRRAAEQDYAPAQCNLGVGTIRGVAHRSANES